MTPLHESLLQPGQPEIIVSDKRVVPRQTIVADVHLLAASLGRARSRRVLLQARDPAELLTAILACQEAQADLLLVHANLPEARVSAIADSMRVDTLIQSAARAELECVTGDTERTAGQSAIFLMTSGTTGQPKVVEHRLDRLIGRILPSAKLESNRDSRWLLTYQPTAFAGLQVILTAGLTNGVIIEATERTPGAFSAAAETHRATHISGTPTFWRAFLMACDPRRLACLRQITLGGEAIDQVTLDRLAIAFPEARITQIYASSEGGSLLAISDGREGFPAEWLDQEVQGVRLRIQEGVLEVRSPRSMVGCFAADGNAPALNEGWLNTGDLVARDGDRVVFLGRRDAMINVGGTKVYPQQIENFLLTLPGVEEARVRGVASPITGQAIQAEVVVAAGLEEGEARRAILQACRAQLARPQVPAMIRIVPVIAVAESGKKSLEFA